MCSCGYAMTKHNGKARRAGDRVGTALQNRNRKVSRSSELGGHSAATTVLVKQQASTMLHLREC